jgi:hypothetical protein
MEKKKLLIKSFLIIWFVFNCQMIYSQNDSIADSQIYNFSKPLQFGNDFDFHSDISVINNLSISTYNTEFSRYYDQKYLVYDPVKDPKRLLYNTGLFLGAAVVTFGVLWVMPESFTNWDKEEMRDYGLVNRWKDNVRAGPVWDEDGIFLNWIMHPWVGGIYYMSARGSGYNKWQSFAYTAIMSTFFWEYGIEAFAEIPSWQDLIITPILGSVLGEQFFRWKGNIIRNEKKLLNSRFLGRTTIFLMDPMNQILDGFGYKTKNKVQTYSMIAPIEYDFISNKTIWGLQVVLIF